jgi:predicted RecA/RadA family phage recombinase
MVEGSGVVDCLFESLPLCRRQYVLRMTITDAHQLVSYDVVSAGPRFAVTATSGASGQSGDDGDGLVSLPYRFDHHVRVLS